jgi:hypothetical protein
MKDGPCPEHPGTPRIGGLCGACTIVAKLGVVNLEFLAPLHETGCRSTIHCANYGFCDRCSPELAEASGHVMKALGAIDQQYNGSLYAEVMGLMRKATE